MEQAGSDYEAGGVFVCCLHRGTVFLQLWERRHTKLNLTFWWKIFQVRMKLVR